MPAFQRRTQSAAQSVADTSAAPRVGRAWVALTGVVGFAILTALGAQIRVWLPGTPVPVTLQTLPVLLAGMTLGPWLGAASMAFYLLLGAVGAPVFADAVWRDGVLIGHTAGYLIGFVLAQPALGLLSGARAEMRFRWARALAAALAGNAVLFTCGVTWLAAWLDLSAAEAIGVGLVPFVPGAVLKSGLAVGLAAGTRPVFKRLVQR